MNKLMIATITAGLAVGAYAEAVTDTFEGESLSLQGAWALPEEGSYEQRPYEDGEALTGAGEKYLHLEDTATRQLGAGEENEPAEIGSVFIDTLVKFTATDTDPQVADGSKLAVWLKDNGDDTTTLMVTCGAVDENLAAVPINVAVEASVTTAEWHRLVVKPVIVDKDAILVGFNVFVDGKQLSTTEKLITDELLEALTLSADMKASIGTIFPSLVTSAVDEEGYTSLSSLVFQGTGDIDNVTVTDDDPYPPAPPTPTEIDVQVPDGEGWTATVEPAKAVPGASITVTYTAVEGKCFKNGEPTMTADGTLNADGTISFETTPETDVQDITYTVTLPTEVTHATAKVTVGEAEVSGTNGVYIVDYKATVTITWTAAAGYEIKDETGVQTIEAIVEDTEAEAPTVEAITYTITYTYTDGEAAVADVTNENVSSFTVESETITIDTNKISKANYTVVSVNPAEIVKGTTNNVEVTVTLKKVDSEDPTDWGDVTDENLDKVVELPEGSDVDADDIKKWAEDNGVTFEAGEKIPVNALIFNVKPTEAPTAVTAEKEAADEVLAKVIDEAAKDEIDLAALLAQAVEAGEDGLTIDSLAEQYPMAVIKLVPATALESTENAKFFQLSITLK